DAFRCLEVLLGKHGRQRKHVADIIEAVAIRINRKFIRDAQVYAEQIANGAVVFVAVQAARRHPAGIRFAVPSGRSSDRGAAGKGERNVPAKALQSRQPEQGRHQNDIRPDTNMERLLVPPPPPPKIVAVICPNWAEVGVVLGNANWEWLATLYRSPRS